MNSISNQVIITFRPGTTKTDVTFPRADGRTYAIEYDRYVSEEERRELFRVVPPAEPLIDDVPRPRMYLFIGVEVDKHGTWARYVTRGNPR